MEYFSVRLLFWCFRNNNENSVARISSGSWIGSSAWFAFPPELKIGIVSIANKHPSARLQALVALTMIIGKDPQKDFPLLNYQAHLKKLSRHYKSYKGSSSYKVYPKEGTLCSEKVNFFLPWIKLNQWDYDILSVKQVVKNLCNFS